ncbi:MAG: EscU/YscU/HrcU family type III secretion system export apparatus switch protein [Pseudomonadota bacterium]|nr:EscU/YscU/HrcU family type III secretion system export apparatus switch protein [Pseudomonadota bacterium]
MATGDEPADKDRLAVALAYDPQKEKAPHVAAKGRGYVAEAIIELARRHGIEIREDRDLAGLLAKLDIDTPIPIEAYTAVAEILSYVYRANEKARRKHEG